MTKTNNAISVLRISTIGNDSSADKLKAVASVQFGAYIISGLKIINGEDRFFVAMPSETTDSGFRDVIHPTTQAFRQSLESAILNRYDEANDNDCDNTEYPEGTVLTDELDITDIKLRYFAADNSETLKACFSVTIANSLAIHAVKIMSDEENRLYVVLPVAFDKASGLYRSLVKFTSYDAEDKFSKTILDAYRKYKLVSSIQ